MVFKGVVCNINKFKMLERVVSPPQHAKYTYFIYYIRLYVSVNLCAHGLSDINRKNVSDEKQVGWIFFSLE